MNLTTETVPLDALTPHPRNVRQGDVGAISESLKAHGQYRPIVAQRSTGHILAGNHTFKAAQALGWSEIAVTYLDVSDDEGMRILLADNRTNDLATYDDAALAEVLREIAATDLALSGTGFDDDAVDALISGIASVDEMNAGGSAYSQKVKVPIYEIVGDKPSIEQLADTSKTNELIAEIDAATIPDEIKTYLRLAAHRHIVFDYGKAAEYYAHCTPEVQGLFERSVLVIIDAADAIAQGYARFALTLDELMDADGDA